MTLINEVSGVSSRGDFFKELPREIVWRPGGGRYLEISPKHHVSENLDVGSPIIFTFPYVAKAAYNFSQSYMRFKLRIQTRAGGNPVADRVYGAVGIGHTVWKNIELFAGNIPVTNSFQPYGYKKIIEHLLTSEQGSEYHNDLWGYEKRLNPGDLDADTSRVSDHFNQNNPLKNEEWCEMMIYPNLDFFKINSNVLCLEPITWEMRLTPQDMRHCLNWSVDLTGADETNKVASLAENYKIEIEPSSLRFFLKIENLTDEAYIEAMDAGRERGFVYNYTPTTIKNRTLTAGESLLEYNDFSPRANPLLYAHTFVAHEAFVGHKGRNPYHFRPPGHLRRIYNWFNGELIGEQSPVLFGNLDQGMRQLYINNLNALEIDEYSRPLTWSSADMAKGFFFKLVSLKTGSESLDLIPMTTPGTHSYKVELEQGENIAYTFLTYTQYEPAQIILYEDGTVTNSFII